MENRGPMLLVLNGTFMGLMLWSMALRIWVRLGLVKSWGWDDSLMAIAVVRDSTLRTSTSLQTTGRLY